VSFKLAAASLEKGQMPDPSTVRSEEFINAFDYRDPEPQGSAPIAFAWERARYPFAYNREPRPLLHQDRRERTPARPSFESRFFCSTIPARWNAPIACESSRNVCACSPDSFRRRTA